MTTAGAIAAVGLGFLVSMAGLVHNLGLIADALKQIAEALRKR